MTTPTYFTAPLRSLFTALLLTLTACGGGVETGGTGAGAYVQGPISGFGSIIVSGVRFDDGCAACIVDADNAPFARASLRLGMLVEVESGPISDDGSGGRIATATRVRLASELLGPVGVVDLANARIGVLGQLVRLTPATVVDGVVGGAAALASNDVVEVFGFFDPVGGYVATRIERRAGMPANYRIRGAVRNLDVVARTLRIGLQTFDLTATGVPAELTDGQFVRLSLQTTQVAGRWPVVGVALESRSAGDRDEAEVEGLISEFISTSQFSVNGVRVDATNAVNTTGVALGVRVKVRGRSQAGVLVAASVDIRSDDDAFSEGVDIRDVIGTVNAATQTFTLRGITVFYGLVPPDRFDHGTVADLAAGRRVRVRGVLGADRTRVVATRIEFVNN
jgi:Domain of unknown function (DUF5666)